ncbi:MAG: GDP-mannose 4,6-dehydratase [Candidatus Thermoplasmatota archaeon]|jgi:GDPmannose 4,6-dehydratase|nr:GDP-mannose 4,6-dehydratase [Candidatus Thermoplasmatota archaeon]
MRKAIITGISGQDGLLLTELLLKKGYEVHGLIRRNSSMTVGNLKYLSAQDMEKVVIHYGDLTDAGFLAKLLKEEKPEELYHLAAQSFVGYSFQNPSSTYDVNIAGTLNIANAIKEYSTDTRLYFAASSEMFGQPEVVPQNEETPFRPRSPYAVSKLAGYWTCKNYRDAYGLFISNGILFNHESEFRGPEFVTRKISKGVSRIVKGDKNPIELGNLSARKDWGYARDYVEGMWMMLNYKYGDDFVLGTGKIHTVREFAETAFESVGIHINWKGSGLNEVGLSDRDEVLVRVNKDLFRPLEADNYQADYSKAMEKMGWKPKIDFKKLVKIMVDYDLKN